MTTTFTLTTKTKAYLETRYKEKQKCVACGKPLDVGQKIVSKPVTSKKTMEGNHKTRRYHSECWKKLFH